MKIGSRLRLFRRGFGRRILHDAFQHARDLLIGAAEEQRLDDLVRAGRHREEQDRLGPEVRSYTAAGRDELDPVGERVQKRRNRQHDHVGHDLAQAS